MTYNYEQFLTAMEAAVAERGADWQYPDTETDLDYEWHGEYGECVYSTPDGQPACIVGLALFKLDPELLPDHDIIASASEVLPSELFGETVEEYDKIVTLAESAQRVQDSKSPWGSALDFGKAEIAARFPA